MQVQLVDVSRAELPYVESKANGSRRRYYIGRPGQQFAVRAEWADLPLSGTGHDGWVLTCKIDGRSLGRVHWTGVHPDGYNIHDNNQCVFRSIHSTQSESPCRMAFAPTTVSTVDDAQVDSSHGSVRVAIYLWKDLYSYRNIKAKPSRAPTDLLGVEESAVTVPTGTKFYHAPGLTVTAIPSEDTDSRSSEYSKWCRNWTYSDLVVEATIHYDTAERLALRSILPPTHPSYPQDFMEAQTGLRALTSRQATSDQLSRFQSMLADPAVRAALPPTLVNAVEFFVNNKDVVHSCDLTGEEEAEVWQTSKKVKQEVTVGADV